MLIDTHAHLQDEQYKEDLQDVLKRAEDAGLEKIICVGYDYASSCQALELARKIPQVYAVVGVHPHDSQELNEEILAKLFEMAKDPRVVAIGEIGLDFYRDLSPREDQRKAFIAQIKLAQELYKPIVIHDRDAHQEVMDIIKKEKAGRSEGIMHCFSGFLPMAIDLMKQGFYISFAGPLTFKNAKKTVEVAAKMPQDRILIETDCPYLSPEPFRGKRNEPARVSYIAAKLAEIRQKSVKEITYITSLNARKVFRIKD
ncbi:MAG: TatD family hydrolase [Syntrophomonadaceae bacterium]|nr:TatD family hydrolase [Syntrophomonadaceae bacterium]MDD3889293.1 TatD family hydrolase [Syntrophomonadaceae bacterium]MDD4549854.1 TatD family hydrolase [Syntrophomonadaceae bacterium]